MWKTVWITGGATGIGGAVSLKLAHQGAKVIVSSRRASVIEDFCAQHDNLIPYPLDVTDNTQVQAALPDIEKQYGAIDLAIFAAGTYSPADMAKLDRGNFEHHIAVNYMGVVTPLVALLPYMQRRKAGHLAIVSSVAGYNGLPKAAAYGPSKAALINLAETLKLELPAFGIDVTLINPGFVKTPMTAQNDFKMPQLISAEKAADHIITGLAKKKFEIAFPYPFVGILKFLRLMPYCLYFPLVRILTGQKSS